MSEILSGIGLFLLGLSLGCGLASIANSTTYDKGYRQGQIDVQNNVVKWHLERDATNQTVWVERKEK